MSLVSRQLGMTIENVFERTIVRSVHPNSEAYKLNVKTNSVILNIGSSSTRHQTHLETLEALKNTVRPVRLRLCQANEKVLLCDEWCMVCSVVASECMSFGLLDVQVLAGYRVDMQSLVQRQRASVGAVCAVVMVL